MLEYGCDFLGCDVMAENEPEWLKRVRRNHFKIGIAALEVVEAFSELDTESDSIESKHNFNGVHDHLSVSKDS